ncbi:UNVERIFIED_CONTAM: hypothetical protein FKN15_069315 [Acipenser sinensis]
MNTRCPPKRVPSAARFFTHCELTVQPPQSYSVGGQRSSGQLTGKPAGARPDYRGRWCAALYSLHDAEKLGLDQSALVEASIAALVQAPKQALLTKDTSCPNKQCRVSEVILKRAYSAGDWFSALIQLLNSQPWRLSKQRNQITGAEDLTASQPIEPTALGLDPDQLQLSRLGLSNRIIDTMQNARAVSTHSQYEYKWGVFQTWCLPQGFDPMTCPMAVILQFWQDLFDVTLKVYLAGISACHVKIDSSPQELTSWQGGFGPP